MSIGTQGGIYFNGNTSAFLGYLASNDNNVTGNSTAYTLGTNVALTEVFDQNSDFDGKTYTAPVSGICIFTTTSAVTGTTVANAFQVNVNTSNRNYRSVLSRTASSANFTPRLQALADMDAGDIANGIILVGGEAAATDDLAGGANAFTHFSGCLAL